MATKVGDLYVRISADDRDFQRAARETEAGARRASGGLGGLLIAAGGVVTMLGGKLTQSFRGVVGMLTGAVGRAIEFTSIGLLTMAKGMRQVAESTRDANGELSAMGKVGMAAARGIETAVRVVLIARGALLGLKIATAAATAALVIAAHRAAADFAPAWNKVITNLDAAGKGFYALKVEVSRLAASVGKDGKLAAATLYEIFGAMPQLAKEPTRALGLLREALEVDATGFATAGEAADALVGILNAFNMQVEQSTEVLDALWESQKAGKFEFGEVAREIGPLAATVSSLGGSYKDVLAILATTTPLNIPVPQAVTQIESALGNMMKQSEEAKQAARELGIEFSASSIRAKGLANVLVEIIEATKGNPELLGRFFGRREGQALMIQLSQRLPELRQRIEEVSNAAGAHAQIVDQMSDSWEAQKEILGQQMPSILRDLGFEFEGWGIKALKALNGVIFRMRDLDEQGKKLEQKRTPWSDLEAAVRQEEERRRAAAALPRPTFAAPAAPALPGAFGAGLPTPALSATTDLFGSGLLREAPAAPPSTVEPATVEHARQKIADLRTTRTAAAVADFARTGDMQAYEAALEKTRVAVNELVLAEMKRLRAAGVGAIAVEEMASLYEMPAKAAKSADAAVERLNERVREFRQSAALGLPLFDEPATDAKAALQQLLALENDIAAAEKDRRDAGAAAPAGTDLVLHAMRMQRDLLREGLRWNVDAAPVYRELDGISQAAKQVKLSGEFDIDAVRASVRKAERMVAENPATFAVRAPSVGQVLRELNAALESGAPEVEIRARLARLAPLLAEARGELAESPLVLDVRLQDFASRIKPELASARQLIQETFTATPDGVVGLRAAMDAAAGAAERLAEARAKAARTDPTDTVALAVAQHRVAAAESELAQKTGLVSRALAALPPKSDAVRQATEHLMAVLQMAGITMDQLAVSVDRGLRIPSGGGAKVLGEEMDRVSAATDAALQAQQRYQAELAKDPGSEATRRAREELKRTRQEAEKLGKKFIAMLEAAAAASAIPAAQATAAIQQIRAAMDDVAPQTESTAKSATSIAEQFETAGRAVLGVLDATGKLDAETRRTLTGAIDLVRAYEQMRKASSGLDKLVAGAGIVGAGISIAVGIANMIDGNKEEKRAERMKLLESNYRLVKALDALRMSTIRDMTSGERKSLLAGAEAFEKRFGRTLADIERDGLSNRMRPKLTQEEFNFLARLQEVTGADFFDQSGGWIDIEKYRKALAAFKDTDLGGFAKGVEGRLDALDFTFEHAGGVIGGATDRMQLFVDAVRQFSPEFASEFEAILKAQGMDAARAWLEALAARYAAEDVAGVVDIFGQAVNAAQIERILEAGFKRLDDLAAGAAGAASALNKLGSTIEGRRRLDDLEAQIRGDDAPTGQIDRELQRVKAFAPALARAFGLEGIDATTEEGRAKLKAALLALIDAIRAGAITAEQLGEIDSADELLGIIGTLAGGLDSLAEHVGAMSDEIYNGVRGFKAFSYELERFRAADPSESPGAPSPPQPPAAQPPTGPGWSPNDGARTGGVNERPASPTSSPAYLLLPPEMMGALEALATKGVGPSAALDEQLAKLAEQAGTGARSLDELLRQIGAGLAQAARTLPAAGGNAGGPELTPAALKALAGMGGGASVTDNSTTNYDIAFNAEAGPDGRIDWRQELPELMRELKRLQQLHKGESGGVLEVL